MSRIIAGGQLVCYINGKAYGKVTGFSFNSETPTKEISGLDMLTPVEEAVTTARCSGRLSLVRTVGDGGIQGAGMSVQFTDLASMRYFTIQLVDIVNNLQYFEARNATCQSESWSSDARDYVKGSMSWKALDWNNEIQSLSGS